MAASALHQQWRSVWRLPWPCQPSSCSRSVLELAARVVPLHIWVPLYKSWCTCEVSARMCVSVHMHARMYIRGVTFPYRHLHVYVVSVLMCMYIYISRRQGSVCLCIHACAFTCDFSDSGVLATLIISRLFFWHTQHRSDIGFMTVMCGVRCLHSEQKVV